MTREQISMAIDSLRDAVRTAMGFALDYRSMGDSDTAREWTLRADQFRGHIDVLDRKLKEVCHAEIAEAA